MEREVARVAGDQALRILRENDNAANLGRRQQGVGNAAKHRASADAHERLGLQTEMPR
jgi:hypothetical protein